MNQAKVNITGIEREKLLAKTSLIIFTEPQKAVEVYQEVFAKDLFRFLLLTFPIKMAGLQMYYSMDLFIKMPRGKGAWCSQCGKRYSEQKKWATELRAAKQRTCFSKR